MKKLSNVSIVLICMVWSLSSVAQSSNPFEVINRGLQDLQQQQSDFNRQIQRAYEQDSQNIGSQNQGSNATISPPGRSGRVDQYTSSVDITTDWYGSRDTALSMARTIAKNRLNDLCRQQGHRMFYSDHSLSAQAANELRDFNYDFQISDGGRTQYRVRAVGRAFCGSP